jgi:hypothetical protein
MKYNLALTHLLSTESGTKILTDTELSSLVNGNSGSSTVTVSGTEQLSLLIDLKARYSLEEVVYYSTAAAEETILIQGRQNDLDLWYELPITVSGSQVSATLSGTYNKYQTINIIHSVVTGTASPLEVELYTSDKEVKFGSFSEGAVEEYPVSSGDTGNTAQEVFIRNVDEVEHDYYILIEDNSSHSPVEVALEEAGPYYLLRDNSVTVPDTYSWASGIFDNTQVDGSNRVVITASVSGTYYSPIIDISSLEGPRIFWDATSSGSSIIDNTLDLNAQQTIGVRISDTVPEGGWSSGQTSTDSLWDVTSGTLSFNEYANNTILPPAYKSYVQFRVELSGDASYPKLNYVGLEYPIVVTISGGKTDSVFVRTTTDSKDGNAELVTWFFEPRARIN